MTPTLADVAVVGGGPAGLAAAVALRRAGVSRVLVLEREAEAGGVPRHCAHPPYGLREFGRLLTGPAYARRLRALAAGAGVEVRTGHTVVALHGGGRLDVATPEGAETIQARRVILATGTREATRAARLVGGDRPLGVLNTGALQSFLHLKGLKPFERPVVVGTELVGLSALWTCLRHGIRPVAVVEEGAHATARWPLGLFPRVANVPVFYGSRIAEIVGAPRVERVEVAGPDGRVTSVACDGVLFTGRFVPEAALLRAGNLAVDRASGGPVVDEDGRCSDPAFVAAGNLLRPVENAGWCFAEGWRAGGRVAAELAAADRPPPGPGLPVRAGAGVRYVVPQRLAAPSAAGALRHLQLRLSAPARGWLTVRADGQVIWRRRVRSRPERRLLVPLAALRVPGGTTGLEVAVEANP